MKEWEDAPEEESSRPRRATINPHVATLSATPALVTPPPMVIDQTLAAGPHSRCAVISAIALHEGG